MGVAKEAKAADVLDDFVSGGGGEFDRVGEVDGGPAAEAKGCNCSSLIWM